jgi:hypothetical protein
MTNILTNSISTVENNWDLGNLGRQDTNKTVASAYFSLLCALRSDRILQMFSTSLLRPHRIRTTTLLLALPYLSSTLPEPSPDR